MFRQFAKFWSEERKRSWLFWAVTFDVIIGHPLVSVISNNFAIETINFLVATALLLLGLFAITSPGTTRNIFGVIITIVIAIRLTRLVLGANLLVGWDTLLTLITLMVFVNFILRYVYRGGPVTWQRVQGAVTAYMLIIIAFSFAFLLVSLLIPGAFKFSGKVQNFGDPRLMYNLYYYSVMTITSVGYGELVAVHPVARTLTAAEALVGQLYPAILLARLVSLYVVHSQSSDKH